MSSLILCFCFILSAQPPVKRYYGPAPNTIPYLSKIIKKGNDLSNLNTTTQLNKYNTKYLSSLNLGIYSTDAVCYTLAEQFTTIKSYLPAYKKLTTMLIVPTVYTKTIGILETKTYKTRASYEKLISNLYTQCNGMLILKKDYVNAALFITGSWLEAIYISANKASSTKNDKLIQKLGEQKFTIEQTIKLLRQYREDDKKINDLYYDFKDLNEYFDEVKIVTKYLPATTDPVTGKTKINTTSTFEVSTETLAKITKKITEMRTAIIAGKF